MATRWIPAERAPPEERWSDAELLSRVQDEMSRVRARLARLTGRDPAVRPAVPALPPIPAFPVVLRLPPRAPPPVSRDGIVVAPGWGDR